MRTVSETLFVEQRDITIGGSVSASAREREGRVERLDVEFDWVMPSNSYHKMHFEVSADGPYYDGDRITTNKPLILVEALEALARIARGGVHAGVGVQVGAVETRRGEVMQTTNIEWADWTWNPVRGCSRISPGCMNCYAELDMARKNSNPKVPGCHGYAEFRIVGQRREAHWTGNIELIESKLLEPLSWRRKALRFAQEHGRKPRVFVNSMSDLFHERLSAQAIDRVFAVMALCPEITFLVLTKRAGRMAGWFESTPARTTEGNMQRTLPGYIVRPLLVGLYRTRYQNLNWRDGAWPLPNVWLGVSVEDQKRADERIPHLRRTPAAVRFLSVEPMLEQIELSFPNPYQRIPGGYRGDRPELMVKPDWVICGGESGPGARPFDIAWSRSLRDQCKAAGVKFFMKQLGSNTICSPTASGGSQVTHFGEMKMHLKDKKGGDPAEWPEDLRIQEVPECR